MKSPKRQDTKEAFDFFISDVLGISYWFLLEEEGMYEKYFPLQEPIKFTKPAKEEEKNDGNIKLYQAK